MPRARKGHKGLQDYKDRLGSRVRQVLRVHKVLRAHRARKGLLELPGRQGLRVWRGLKVPRVIQGL